MTPEELQAEIDNIFAQYRCKHLSWAAVIWALSDLDLDRNKILKLIAQEDDKE